MIYIYCLKDAGKIFYIGKCCDMKIRRANHAACCRIDRTEKAQRIKSILSSGNDFEMILLEECEETNAYEREKYYIEYYSQNGCKLTNLIHNTWAKLTKLEIQVLLLIAQDVETEYIGPILIKSPRTIETIRQRIKKKANVKTLPGLIMWGIENGYIIPNI